MIIKLNKILSITVALILLLAVTVVPTMANSPFNITQPITNKNPLVTSANVKLTILENTATSQKVLVGDRLIQTTSTPDHSYAVMTITNETTKQVDKYEFKVTKNTGVYTTEVINNGKSQGSFMSSVDPLQPNAYKLNNDNAAGANVKPMAVSTMTTANKYWDGVWYTTTNVPYSHPDYDTYISNIYQSNIVWGWQLAAVQIDHRYSGYLITLPIVTMAASIINLCALLAVTVFGGLTGCASAVAILIAQTGLLDEKGNIWVWGSYQQGSIDFWFIHIGLGPKYYKIGSWLCWDFIGLGTP